MDRNQFIKRLGVTAGAAIIAPNIILGQENKPLAYQKDIVRKFVGAGHSNLEVVKELLLEYPNLIYSSHDWGGGDFETAIGAGGHVGYKEMVNFLIGKGARPTLHALTMLGKTELVKPTLEVYPQMINTLGPHGFTFLHHALKGGDEAAELVIYLESKGLKESKISLYA
jgi:hypothetical protein